MLRIDVVGEDDWSVWRSLRLRALQEAPFAFGSTYTEWRDAREPRWRQRLRGPGSLNVVAAWNGSLVGMASGVPGTRPDAIELVSMWVDPSARGTGVADALIASIEQWATSRAEELRLAVVPTNGRAIAVYRRHGFELADEQGDLLRDGSGREMVMKKALNAVSQ